MRLMTSRTRRTERSNPVSEAENKAIMHRYEEAVNQGNLDLIDEVIAADYVGHEPDEDLHGPEGYKQFLTMFRSAFPDLHLTVEDEIAEGDRVASRFTVRGTHQGELMSIPPTGKQITVTGITICRFEDGKVVEEWENPDM